MYSSVKYSRDKAVLLLIFLIVAMGLGTIVWSAIPNNTIRQDAGVASPTVNATGPGYFMGPYNIIDDARAANFTSVNADEFYLNSVNKTDLFAYPQAQTSYTVWVDNSTGTSIYYAKNGTTGSIDFSGTVKNTVLTNVVGVLSSGTIFLKEVTWDTSIAIPTNVLIIEHVDGIEKLYQKTGSEGINSIIETQITRADVFYNSFEATVTKLVPDGDNPLGIFPNTWGMVWKEGAGDYHLFAGPSNINHYTSADGETWVADPGNPVLSNGGAGTWDDANIYCSMVWKEGATYYMLYTGNAADNIAKVGLATAAALGGAWTKEATNPVFENTNVVWGPGAESWGIIKVGATYYMWFNNYGSGTGTRQIGLATSNDLLTWVQDSHNPIYTNRRYCPWEFKWGGIYYMFVMNQREGSNYGEMELYRDAAPTFYPHSREFLGVVKYTVRDSTTWDGGDLDTPAIEVTSINMDLGTSAATIRVYYSGATKAGVWDMGLATMSTGNLQTMERLYDTYTSAYEPSTAFSLSTDTQTHGSKSFKIDVTVTSDGLTFPINRKIGVERLNFKFTNEGTYFIYLYGGINTELCTVQLYKSGTLEKIQYTVGTSTYSTGVILAENRWYTLTYTYDCYTGTYGFSIVDTTTGLEVIFKNNVPMKASASLVSIIKIYKPAAATGVLYIDDWYSCGILDSINTAQLGYIPPEEPRTKSGSLTAGVANAIAFAWHNPEGQDILIRKIVIEVTTGGGTVGSHLDVGIADDAAGTNRGAEFFDDLLLNNAQIDDSWLAGDGGTQTKWVFCQDFASVTDGWVVGQILDANAASLVGKWYIEYIVR